VIYEILRRDLPTLEREGESGRRVVLARQLTHADYVGQAFDEIRRSAASLPGVAAALVETLAGVAAGLADDGIVDAARLQPLTHQAALVIAGVERTSPLVDDMAPVRRAGEALLGDKRRQAT